jgi:hypothetical protein
MSILKSALVACVMTTLAMLLGYMAPAAIKVAHAQAVPFPPCVNDFRAEIASGQRSPHYPRCLDAHSPSNTRLSGSPTRFDNLPGNCPAGQVYSGGACVTIQNQGSPGSWVSGFLGQQKCYSSHCVRIESSGQVFYGAGWDNLRTLAPPSGLSPVQFEGGSCGDSCTPARILVEPTINNNSMALTGGNPTGWRFCFIDHYNRLTPCVN